MFWLPPGMMSVPAGSLPWSCGLPSDRERRLQQAGDRATGMNQRRLTLKESWRRSLPTRVLEASDFGLSTVRPVPEQTAANFNSLNSRPAPQDLASRIDALATNAYNTYARAISLSLSLSPYIYIYIHTHICIYT